MSGIQGVFADVLGSGAERCQFEEWTTEGSNFRCLVNESDVHLALKANFAEIAPRAFRVTVTGTGERGRHRDQWVHGVLLPQGAPLK
jgi:hypothetical protein